MKGNMVAGRYARALYEAAAAQDAVIPVTKDMDRLRQIITEVAGIKKYCLGSHESRQAETEFVEIAFIPYISGLTGGLLREAVKNGRLASVPFIPEAFGNLLDKESGSLNVILETARKPEPAFMEKITHKMENRTGKKVILKNNVVPEIMGGFRLLWRNRMLDLSAAGRIKNLRKLVKSA